MWGRLRLPRFGGAIHAIEFDNRSRYRQVCLSSAWRRCGRPGGDPSAKTSLRGKRRFSDVDVERARLLQQYALHRASPDAERLRCLEIDGQLEFGRLLDRQIGGLFAFKDTPDVPAYVMADKPQRSGRPSSGRFLAPSKAQSPMKTAPTRSRAEDKFSYTGRAEICDRYGADKRSRNSALLASYLAAARLPSEPSMTVLPSVVDTYHLHFRPRLFTTTSKTGNRNSIAQASYGTRTPISATNMPAKSTFEEDQPINEII